VGVVVGDGGDDACGSVGWGGDDAASGGVLFVDGHGVDGYPVDGGERVFGADGVEAFGETVGSAADVQASGKDAFGGYAALGALPHGLPDGEDAGSDFFFGGLVGWRGTELRAVDGEVGVIEESDFVGQHQFRDGQFVFRGDGEEVCRAAERVGDGAGGGEGFGGALCFGDDEAPAYGVENFFGELLAGIFEGGEAHSVGV